MVAQTTLTKDHLHHTSEYGQTTPRPGKLDTGPLKWVMDGLHHYPLQTDALF